MLKKRRRFRVPVSAFCFLYGREFYRAEYSIDQPPKIPQLRKLSTLPLCQFVQLYKSLNRSFVRLRLTKTIALIVSIRRIVQIRRIDCELFFRPPAPTNYPNMKFNSREGFNHHLARSPQISRHMRIIRNNAYPARADSSL